MFRLTELNEKICSEILTEKSYAIIIDGNVLSLALHPDLAFKFLTLSSICKSVICCRCTPLQKGAVVDLVSDYSMFRSRKITLAIGDGANDVPMIQKAHVGVGINDGKEGMQAAMASDFSIPRFSMLVPLLLKYGSRSYKRISKLILYSFVKNFALCLPTFWFGFGSAFSAQMIYFDFFFTLFNSIFTALPILLIAFEDIDFSDNFIERFPYLYTHGIMNLSFGIFNFIGTLLNGFWISLIVYSCSFLCGLADINSNGQLGGIWTSGAAAFGYLVVSLNFLVLFYHSSMNYKNWIACILSMTVFFPATYIYCSFLTLDSASFGVVNFLFENVVFWLGMLLCVITSILPYYVYFCFVNTAYSSAENKINNNN